MTAATRRPVRVTLEGEAYNPLGSDSVLMVVLPNDHKVCLTEGPGVTVEDIVQPRVWTDGDVVQEVASDRVWRRVHREDGQHAWSNGFLAVRCLQCRHAVRALQFRQRSSLTGPHPPGNAAPGCLRGQPVATLPPKPVNGCTDKCLAPGYAGRHTAVGAGAISSPYLCHGCGAWFTLPPADPEAGA